MAETTLIFGSGKRTKIGVLQLDCTLDETHSLENMITEHPVEEGVNISDHIRRQPRMLEITGVVTNTPVVNFDKEEPLSPDISDTLSPVDRVRLAYAKVDELLVKGEIIDVQTTLETYRNMIIQDYSIPRNVETGNTLNVTISLRELLTAKTEQVAAPEPVVVSKRLTTDQGKKAKKPSNAIQEEKTQSALSKLTGSLFSG